MSIISGENLFMLTVWLFVIFWAIVGALLVLHFLMPKAVLADYFKKPHFNEFELKLFTGLPYAPIRTIMFMTVLAFPKRGKKRGLTEAHRLAPAWYKLASGFVIVGLVATGASILLILLGFFVYDLMETG